MTDVHDGAVLVTGGAGYVAPPLVRRLAESGRAVVVLDDFSTGRREHARWGTLVEGDAGDAELVAETIRTHGVEAVMHFAAKALVGESMQDPALYDRWNRGKTEVFARTAAREGVKAFVFSSTCAVYGDPVTVPIPEDHALKPVNPYGRSKVACENALFGTGVPTAALRYFNAAGAEPAYDLGERHDPETHLIPLAIHAVQRDEPITIFGTDYPTPDGTCVRDYIHVVDLAAVHLAALERLETTGRGGVWNLGTGHGLSVREILDAVGRVAGRPVPSVEGARREGDPPALVAHAERARRDLGFVPRASDIDRIVGDAWAFAEHVRRTRA
ncbi:MAG: UDP-glucose 4-epimerase GalE [Planctomycetota bacterium]